jgi:hypothetical protein
MISKTLPPGPLRFTLLPRLSASVPTTSSIRGGGGGVGGTTTMEMEKKVVAGPGAVQAMGRDSGDAHRHTEHRISTGGGGGTLC